MPEVPFLASNLARSSVDGRPPADVFTFQGSPDVSPEANLAEFVDGMRSRVVVFGEDLDFEGDVWDVTHHVRRRASDARIRLYFHEWSDEPWTDRVPFAEPFRSFAKAIIRYFQGTHPTKQPQHRVTALCALYEALKECMPVPSPLMASVSTFDRAAQLIRESHIPSSQSRYGSMLAWTADFLDDNFLCPARLAWKNPFKAVSSVERVGPEFDARRMKRLPSRAALEAIAASFRQAKTDEDVAFASLGLLLCACPSRISEWLTAPVDIEARLVGNGTERPLRLRWRPSKGGRPTTKIIPAIMVPLVQMALRNLTRIGAAARKVARWYEEHPGQLWLPPDLESIRSSEVISMDDARRILGDGSLLDFLKKHRIRLERRIHKRYLRFAELERAVLSTLPIGFPVLDPATGLRFRDALCVSLHNQLQEKRNTWHCRVDRIGEDDVRRQFGAYEPRIPSMFSRFSFREPDGTPIKVQTHMLRRYSNTIAKRAGLSDRDIQLWSDRRKVRQNDPYDLESPTDMLARLQSQAGDPHKWLGPLAHVPGDLPLTREEFASINVPAILATEIGYCLHVHAMVPCPKRLKCLRCTEHVCIKGAKSKTANVRLQLEQGRRLLDVARAGMSKAAFGADRWVETYLDTVARLESLLAILENPDVPDGTVVQLGSRYHPLPPRLALPAPMPPPKPSTTPRRRMGGKRLK